MLAEIQAGEVSEQLRFRYIPRGYTTLECINNVLECIAEETDEMINKCLRKKLPVPVRL